MTREQRTVVEELSWRYGRVKVTPRPDGNVVLTVPRRTIILDEDGVEVAR